jgi:hypothetical protein
VLPSLRTMSAMLDRLKTITDVVSFEASTAGDLSVSIDTVVVSVSTKYSNLQTPLLSKPPLHSTTSPSVTRLTLTLTSRRSKRKLRGW